MEIKIGDITDLLESIAPLSFQEHYDNAGLFCGSKDEVCSGVFVCLDVSEKVIDNAIEKGCNLIVSHHPLVFRGLKSLLPQNNVAKTVLKAVTNNICLYSSHTNLDAAKDGVNTLLAKTIGLEGFEPFNVGQSDPRYFGIGGMGFLSEPLMVEPFLRKVKDALSNPHIRYVEGRNKQIKSVALCSGSGSEFIPLAIEKGADCYLTGDLKYHDFLDAEGRIVLADIGHFESEALIKRHIVSIISKNFCNFVPLFCDDLPNRVKSL